MRGRRFIILLNKGGAGGAPSPGWTKFDTPTLSNATLSADKLTATRTNGAGGTGGAQSIAYKTGMKLYWEVLVNSSHGNTDFVGVMAATYGYAACVNGNAGDGAGIWLSDGRLPNHGSSVGTIGAANAPGTIIRNAWDSVNNKFWQAVNGGLWEGSAGADPATNTGGRLQSAGVPMAPVIAFSPFGSPQVGDNLTANFGAGAFTYAAPANFTAGYPA